MLTCAYLTKSYISTTLTIKIVHRTNDIKFIIYDHISFPVEVYL